MENKPKEQFLLIAFFAAMFTIFLLLIWIFIKREELVPTEDTQKLKDSIEVLTQRIEKQKAVTTRYLQVVDSLESLPPVITIIYREQKKFTSTATVDQLDSIIRANSGLTPRTKRY